MASRARSYIPMVMVLPATNLRARMSANTNYDLPGISQTPRGTILNTTTKIISTRRNLMTSRLTMESLAATKQQNYFYLIHTWQQHIPLQCRGWGFPLHVYILPYNLSPVPFKHVYSKNDMFNTRFFLVYDDCSQIFSELMRFLTGSFLLSLKHDRH